MVHGDLARGRAANAEWTLLLFSRTNRTQQCRLQNRCGARDSQSKGIESGGATGCHLSADFYKGEDVGSREWRQPGREAGRGGSLAEWGPSPRCTGRCRGAEGLSRAPHTERLHGSQLARPRPQHVVVQQTTGSFP